MLQVDVMPYASDALEDAMVLAQVKSLNSFTFSDCLNHLNYCWSDIYNRVACIDEGYYAQTVRLTSKFTRLPKYVANTVMVYRAQSPAGYARHVYRAAGAEDMNSEGTYTLKGFDLYVPDADRHPVWLQYVPSCPQLFFTHHNRDPKTYETGDETYDAVNVSAVYGTWKLQSSQWNIHSLYAKIPSYQDGAGYAWYTYDESTDTYTRTDWTTSYAYCQERFHKVPDDTIVDHYFSATESRATQLSVLTYPLVVPEDSPLPYTWIALGRRVGALRYSRLTCYTESDPTATKLPLEMSETGYETAYLGAAWVSSDTVVTLQMNYSSSPSTVTVQYLRIPSVVSAPTVLASYTLPGVSTTPFSGFCRYFDVDRSSGTVVVVGASTIWVFTNDLTAVSVYDAPSTDWLSGVTYVPETGYWVAGNGAGEVLYSRDARSWQVVQILERDADFGNWYVDGSRVAYSPPLQRYYVTARLYINTGTYNVVVYWSSDLEHWSALNSVMSSVAPLTVLKWSPEAGMLIASSYQSTANPSGYSFYLSTGTEALLQRYVQENTGNVFLTRQLCGIEYSPRTKTFYFIGTSNTGSETSAVVLQQISDIYRREEVGKLEWHDVSAEDTYLTDTQFRLLSRQDNETTVDVTPVLQRQDMVPVYLSCDFPYIFASWQRTYANEPADEYVSALFDRGILDCEKDGFDVESCLTWYNPFAFTGRDSNVRYVRTSWNDKTGMGAIIRNYAKGDGSYTVEELGFTPDTRLAYPSPVMYRYLVARLADKFSALNESNVMGVQKELNEARYAFEAFLSKDKSGWQRIRNVNGPTWDDYL